MILAITDGVGLTDKLSSEWRRAKDIFSAFFAAQIKAFDSVACAKHWRIVKTTGDGLIFAAVDDERCKQDCGTIPCHEFLKAMAAASASQSLKAERIRLRSVMHHCPPVLGGSDLLFATLESKMIDDNARATLTSDVFGLEVIRLARIASIVKGPFHLITEAFVRALVEPHANGKDLGDRQQIRDALRKWKAANTTNKALGPAVKQEPILLPHLKGFEEEGMPHRVHFGKPYCVWEVDFEVGQHK